MGGTDADGVAYGAFLTKLADALHEVGATLSVDVASWDKFFNFTAVAHSSADRVITMDTSARMGSLCSSHDVWLWEGLVEPLQCMGPGAG